MGKGSHHDLLADHPVQIAARQVVALSDEAERLRAIELLPAGREVGTGKRFVDSVFEADIDTAEGVGDQSEAEQPDLGVVVDGDTGQIGDGLDQCLAARLGGFGLGFGGIHALLLDQLLHLLQLDLAVDAVDLRLVQAGRLDVGVSGDRDRGRRLPVVGYADQDDRVGVRRHVITGVQGGELVLGQRVAVRVGATVHADQQDVDRAVLATATERGGAHVEDAVLERPDLAPGDTGADHHGHSDQREHGPDHPLGARPCFGVSRHQPRLLVRWAHPG